MHWIVRPIVLLEATRFSVLTDCPKQAPNEPYQQRRFNRLNCKRVFEYTAVPPISNNFRNVAYLPKKAQAGTVQLLPLAQQLSYCRLIGYRLLPPTSHRSSCKPPTSTSHVPTATSCYSRSAML